LLGEGTCVSNRVQVGVDRLDRLEEHLERVDDLVVASCQAPPTPRKSQLGATACTGPTATA
jgi:hypothetical protein